MRPLFRAAPRAPWALAWFAAVLLFAAPAFAANIIIINNNAAGVGFNDPTPRAPVGGNPGTTLGAQRLFIFQHAAEIWGSLLPSNVTIQVRAQFAAQTCTATSATLGSAGTTTIHRDFTGAPFPGTWYNQALANRLFNADLSTANPDINATFNLSIDAGCFGPGLVWYYGIDGNEGANIELLPVVLHEIGHGLGFQTFTSGTSGAYNSGFPSIYDRFLLDKISGLHWNQNSAAQRVASAVSVDKLVWDGPAAVAMASTYLIGQPEVLVNSPGGIAGNIYTAQDATFGAALTTSGFTGNVVQLEDTTAPINDGCEAITNAAALAGNIALIDRGICTFVAKCAAAQAAGATGVIIVNNAAAGLPGMGGADPTITIPCVGISQADGNTIKANLASGVNVTIRRSPTVKAGADANNRIKVYAPNPFASGSSVSHWDISLTPNALMEPAINNDLHDTVDLTLPHFRDIGWLPAMVGAPSVTNVICPTNTCVTMPVQIRRDFTTPVLGFSVTFLLGGGISLCSGTSSITEGTFLSSAGGTSFQVIDNGGGSYTADGVVLGAACGAGGLTGTLFNVGVTSADPTGTGTLTVTSVTLRDCSNGNIQSMADTTGKVPVDNAAPTVAVVSPNGGESWVIGSSQAITWTATDNVAVANVDLHYSTDGGATYPNTIATAIANSGSYLWSVPNTPSTTARVRVTAHDTGCSSAEDASDADFAIRNPIITASAGTGGSIAPSGPTSVPYGTDQSFTITADACYHIADVLVDGSSVGATGSYTFTNVTADHAIAASFAINVYTIVASAGFGGSISPSGNVPVNCGSDQAFTITPDGCHTIADVLVDGSSVGATATFTFTNVQADHTIAASFSPIVSPVSPVTGLAASQVKTGNDTDGTTKITLTFTAPGGTTVEVWRKGFGGYPTYDDAGGSVPPAPGSYPPAGWTLTGVVTSGQADEAATRDYWYYVAFAKDVCGNVSPVSNRTGGTLGYHLGDVSDGVTPGQGNNSVSTADLSLLGAHYGLSGVSLAGFEYLDVGPTTDNTTNGRPTTDLKTNFEDLVMFALNYTPVVSVKGPGGMTVASGVNLVSLGAVGSVSAGELFDVPVQLTGAGDLQALSVSLRWDPQIVVPVSFVPGEYLTSQGGIVLSPDEGIVDAALLGPNRGMSGQGVVATVRFRAMASGDPQLVFGTLVGRNSANAPVEVHVGSVLAAQKVELRTELLPSIPNPSHGTSVLAFGLASGGPVDLSIYSVDGRRVRTIVRGVQPAGQYRFTWNGTDDGGAQLKAGAYFVHFNAPGMKKSQVITLIR